MIRLVIYLVISIGLLVLLFNLPETPNVKKDEVDDSVQLVKLPENESKNISDEFAFEIEIDSMNHYLQNSDTLTIDELTEKILVQKKKEPKLFLKLTVHPRSKSEILMKVMEFAKREKINIGITKN